MANFSTQKLVNARILVGTLKGSRLAANPSSIVALTPKSNSFNPILHVTPTIIQNTKTSNRVQFPCPVFPHWHPSNDVPVTGFVQIEKFETDDDDSSRATVRADSVKKKRKRKMNKHKYQKRCKRQRGKR